MIGHRPPVARLEKFEPRWDHGVFLGVKPSSNELIVADQQTKAVKFVRTVRRVPEKERWHVDNLDWVRAFPWNLGPGDKDEDSEMPELGIKHGPCTRLTAGEMEDIQAREDPETVHRTHLTKADFDKFGYIDKCGGCSAKLRGMRPQPNAERCCRRMDKLFEGDERLEGVKTRLAASRRKRRPEEADKKEPQEEKGTR